jgi:hypothetical protein
LRYLVGTGIFINIYKIVSGNPKGKRDTGVYHRIILNIIFRQIVYDDMKLFLFAEVRHKYL